MFDRELKKYWKEVEQNLTCSHPLRKNFYKETRKAADRFLEELPKADFSQLEEYLGAPQELAQNYLNTLSAADIQRYYQKRKINKGILILLVAVLLSAIVGLFLAKRSTTLIYVETEMIDEWDTGVPESSPTEESSS